MLDGLALLPRVNILVLDPDPRVVREVGKRLRQLEEGLCVLAAQTLRAAEQTVRTARVGCVVTEARVADAEGTAIVRALCAVRPRVPVIVWTAGGSEELAAAVLKGGAVDYLSKRSASAAEVAAAVRAALGRAVLDALEEAPDLVADGAALRRESCRAGREISGDPPSTRPGSACGRERGTDPPRG